MVVIFSAMDGAIVVRPYKIRATLEEHRDVQKWVDGDIIFKNDFSPKGV